jgi:nucleoside-diphosphate-sugar epimerase
MKIFLTGGTGFIGSHFLQLALEEGHEVVALCRTQSPKTKINLENQPIWLNKSFIEVTKMDFSGIDILLHLAAHSANVPYDNLINCIQYNVVEPLVLFQTAYTAEIKHFIAAGSCFEYGKSGERHEFIPVCAPLEPTQTYPTSKALSSIAFNQFALENKVNLSYLRIFQVFGEGEEKSRLWPSLKKAALDGGDFKMTHGEQIRDFVYVKDVARKLLDEAKLSLVGVFEKPKFVNIGTGYPQSIKQFSEYWWKKWNARGKLLVGNLNYREGEIMRYVPQID